MPHHNMKYDIIEALTVVTYEINSVTSLTNILSVADYYQKNILREYYTLSKPSNVPPL